ncbi:carbon-nitrogen hydrolase family protein [Jiangella asiatica]|uniref:Carbon-nitrogen hydrolase family protein n=1 Tax=Jiangella asiatica TaxID=2530372 RepID=A0A4R5CRS6_9ACTN|nr:carbon-nitrogen hydrolase family protein [Jiangella asiatica]TDE00343.1 carbon-nitrogen hydrolase family protein [Jiangella asiatica]
MPPLRIAVTQPAIAADVAENGRRVRSLLRSAAGAGARLVQFPEGMLSGYAKAQVRDWADVDWELVRAELSLTMEVAAELRVWVVLGSAHQLTPPNRPHNSLYVISDQGRLVDRYDKRLCSNTEITRFYSPGFRPVVFDVDGFRFGCAICIEVNFPDLFAEYERLGVDCVLLSAYPIDAIFATKARAHAAIESYWLGVSVPAQCAGLMASELIGPDGGTLTRVSDPDAGGLAIADLDRSAPDLHIPLNLARPWRATARDGEIYRSRRVDDPRSTDRTCV